MIRVFYILVSISDMFIHQSGINVCSGYFTHDVLLHVSDRWLRAIDESTYTGAVFLDLAKASCDLLCDYFSD